MDTITQKQAGKIIGQNAIIIQQNQEIIKQGEINRAGVGFIIIFGVIILIFLMFYLFIFTYKYA